MDQNTRVYDQVGKLSDYVYTLSQSNQNDDLKAKATDKPEEELSYGKQCGRSSNLVNASYLSKWKDLKGSTLLCR